MKYTSNFKIRKGGSVISSSQQTIGFLDFSIKELRSNFVSFRLKIKHA